MINRTLWKVAADLVPYKTGGLTKKICWNYKTVVF